MRKKKNKKGGQPRWQKKAREKGKTKKKIKSNFNLVKS